MLAPRSRRRDVGRRFRPDPPRTPALVNMVAAAGALHAGPLDEAVATARAAVELAGRIRSSRWRNYVREFLRSAAVHASDPRVVELRQLVAERSHRRPRGP